MGNGRVYDLYCDGGAVAFNSDTGNSILLKPWNLRWPGDPALTATGSAATGDYSGGCESAVMDMALDAGHKLLVVEPYRVDEERRGMKPVGRTLVAVDTVGAGEGELVLVTQGSSARLTPETKNLPVDAVIIGIVDTVHVGPGCVYHKDK